MADEKTTEQTTTSPPRRARSTLENSGVPAQAGTSPLRFVFVIVPAAVLLATATNLLGLWSFSAQQAARDARESDVALAPEPVPQPETQPRPQLPSPAETRPAPQAQQPQSPSPPPSPSYKRHEPRRLATRETRESAPMDWALPLPENEQRPAEPEPEPPVFDAPAIVALVAGADVRDGTATFKMCGICHSSGKGEGHKVGPNLWGIVDRDIAAAPDFRYSRSLREREGSWSYAELAAFLNDPRKHTPGTSMAFRGIEDRTRLANVLAYLRTLSDDPPPLPR